MQLPAVCPPRPPEKLGENEHRLVLDVFSADMRQAWVLLKNKEPKLRVHFIFKNPRRKIRPNSNLTYLDWCSHHGFPCSAAKSPSHLLAAPVPVTETKQVKRRPLPAKLRFAVLMRDRYTCRYCGRSAPDVRLHCDHVLPVIKGGKDTIDNLVASCSTCNQGKGTTCL